MFAFVPIAGAMGYTLDAISDGGGSEIKSSVGNASISAHQVPEARLEPKNPRFVALERAKDKKPKSASCIIGEFPARFRQDPGFGRVFQTMRKIMKYIVFLSLLVFAAVANAQDNSVTVPAEVTPFIDKGSKAIALESADLNGDGTKDYILVLQKEVPESQEADSDEARPLVILIRDGKNKLTEAKRNDRIVLCPLCGGVFGDPFAGITVGRNTFTVNHYGGSAWRWTADYKFNYSRIDKTWQLVRIEKTSYHNVRPMEETLKKTVMTPPKNFGKVDIADFDPADYDDAEKDSEN